MRSRLSSLYDCRRGNIAFFDMYKRKGTLTEDSLRLARDRAKNEKGKLPALSHGDRERFATPAQSENIPQAATKSQEGAGKTLKSYAPYVAPPIAALFGLDDDLGDNSQPWRRIC
jgi:hypothetical protein